jgi:hypothetical protein
VRRSTGKLERRGFAENGRCEQEEENERTARVECGVVVFRTLYYYIERESNRRESCHRYTCHSAELDGYTAYKLG